VVSNATKLVIRSSNDPEPHPARILFIAHDCDLALLEAEDPSHFEHLKPLDFGGIPKLNTEVIAVGYPIGGDRISVTRGVVSRIDFRVYSHSGVDSHLTIQVDAAINPGNSGGPILQDGRVVGVAFQGYSGSVAQNVGYMIPVPVIQRFLKDVEDGSYDHYVDLAVSEFPVENPAQRKALGLGADGVGVMLGGVEPEGSAGGILKPGDALLSIDGSPVFNNGLIKLDDELVNMNEAVERKFAGDKIQVEFLRDGTKMTAEIELKPFEPYRRLGSIYDEMPGYLVYCGLVFQPLERNLMEAHSIQNPLVNYLFDQFLNDQIYTELPEPVILTTVLPDEATTFLTPYAHHVVEEINGVPIKRLSDVPKGLASREDGKDGRFIVIKLMEMNRPLVLRRDLAEEAHPRIMRTYNIHKDAYLGE
jgi:S1-C subfamily serine protease